MWVSKKSDKTVMDALRAANNNRHTEAFRLFQDAGNQCRDPKEKAELWKAADRHRRIARSD